MKIKLLLVAVVLLVVACGGKEEREAKYLERGKALFEQGDFVNAGLEFRNAAQINPKGVEAPYYLALIAEKEGNWRQAFVLLKRVTEQKPDHAAAHLKLGQLYMLSNDLEKAKEQITTVSNVDPNNVDLNVLRGSVAMRENRLVDAEREARAALAKDEAHVDSAMLLASIQAKEKAIDAALETLDQTIKLNPLSVPPRLLRVKMLLDAKRFDDAVAGYHQLFELQPDNFALRLSLAQLYAARNQLDLAEKVLRDAVEAGIGGTNAQIVIVDLIAKKDGFAAAEKELQGLIEAAPDEYAYRFKLADLYAKTDALEKDDALDRIDSTLKEIVELDESGPNGIKARVGLARLALQRTDRDQARVLVDGVLEEDSANHDALLIRGGLALEDGDLDGARADARGVLKNHSRSVPALRLLTEAQLRSNETELAMDTLAQLIAIAPKDTANRERLADLHLRKGNVDKALELYDAVLTLDSSRPASIVRKAEILIAQKKWDDAEKTIRALRDNPENEAAEQVLWGRLYQSRGEPDKALDAFDKAFKLRPAAREPLIGIVQIHVAADRQEEAVSFLNKVVEDAPDNALAWNMLGEIHGRADRIDEAEQAYRQAIVARDKWEVPYANLGNLLLSVDRGEDAVAVYRDGISKLPENDRLQFSLAAAQERGGDGQGAIATYEVILERRPNSELAANNYAALVADFQYDDPEKIDRALQHAKQFETSDNAFYLDTLGWLYYRKGDYQQARIFLDRAVSLRADIPAILYHLGMTLHKLGDNTGARAELEKALANEAEFPGRDEAEKTLRDLHQG